MGGLILTLLGGFEARLGSGVGLPLPTKKAQALLAYLAFYRGRSHPREKLAALLWGEKSDDQARDGLRHAIAALRRALGEPALPCLRIEGQALTLDAGGVEVDVASFERHVADGTPEALERAAELYRGDLLLGFGLSEPLFEEWLVTERERLRETGVQALARLLAHQAKGPATERAIQTAVRLLRLDPLQEAVHRTLMHLYGRQGRRGAALKQYQACVRVLQRELGAEPEAETRGLYQELLRRSADFERRLPPARLAAPASPELPAAETPLFGREAELARLRELLDDVLGGQGRVSTIVGEAGIGKTRLVSAVAAEAVTRGCRVLIGRCHESDSILPFGPWVAACRDGRVAADEQILANLHPARRAELTRLLPEAGAAELPSASGNVLPLFESVASLVEQVAASGPLLLVFEDLHWADEMSLRLLAFVGRRLAAWPVLLVATAGEEELADATMARRTLAELARAAGVAPLALRALSRSAVASLVRALARAGSADLIVARVEERVWVLSEGNPFVVVEAMRGLEPGSAAIPGRDDPGALALPASVRELVGGRLDRLSARGRELAAVAAVIGRGFDFTLLRRAAGMEERAAAEAVDEMVRQHVLQAVGNRLDFTHDRVRDVAYGRLLPPRRRLLHRAVAEALTGEPEQVERLAHHALHGELREQAVAYLREAGARAAARSAVQEARAWFEQALGVLETLPPSRALLEDAFEIRLALRSVMKRIEGERSPR